MHRTLFRIIAVIFGILSGSALADNLSKADEYLCAPIQVMACKSNGDCNQGLPSSFNIPQFIVVDLKKKELRTTEASVENRRTPLKHIQREDGLTVLQGYEMGRAFSFVINEETGVASVAVSRDGTTVSVFGACTPA